MLAIAAGLVLGVLAIPFTHYATTLRRRFAARTIQLRFRGRHELEAMTDTAAAVSADAQQALGGGGRWMNITDSLSGAQASQSYHSRSDSSRSRCEFPVRRSVGAPTVLALANGRRRL